MHKAAIDDRDRLAAYLLGELSAEEQLRIEQDYFASDAAYEQLLSVEDELAYDYLQGRLSPQRRLRFESAIGSTERGHQNLAFARSLLDALKASRASQAGASWPVRYWPAAIAAALVLAIPPTWLAFRVAGLTAQLEKLRAESAATAARFERGLAAAKNARAPLEAAFLLAPGLARSAEGPTRLELPPQAEIVRFELVQPPGAAPGDYVITVRAANGAEVWSRSGALAGRTLPASLPAGLLAAGEYEITLRRLTAGEQAPDLATYSFRLIRK